MKILIFGSSGNIGGFLTKSLNKYYEVIETGIKDIDITNKNEVIDFISNNSPDFVIDSAGIADVDFCEKNEDISYSINTLGTMNIAIACSKKNIPLIYISSAQVYGSSENSSHFEHDICDPVNIFGKSKLAGENLIRTLCKKYYIIRTSWCFGGEKCFVKKIIDKKNIPIFMVADMKVNLTYLGDLAKVVLSMINSESYGIYNCTNKGSELKSNVVKYIFSQIGCSKEVFPLPASTLKALAPRPKDCLLNTDLMESSFNIELPSWKDRMIEYIDTIMSLQK